MATLLVSEYRVHVDLSEVRDDMMNSCYANTIKQYISSLTSLQRVWRHGLLVHRGPPSHLGACTLRALGHGFNGARKLTYS